jgi:ubiquinone/menaquinone biosynthesis C-methylase UbiE
MAQEEKSSPMAQATTWDLVAPGYVAASVAHFEKYASDALNLAKVSSGQRIVDVATGPGSLALLAAKRGAQVDALDFSHEMIQQLRARAKAEGLIDIRSTQGDGQSLPFADETYDAGFSMFGLFMFPDRNAGFRELYRVLKPGGVCVVSSWHPMDKVELLGAIFEALYSELPELPQEKPEPALGDPDAIRSEMSPLGFAVEVHEVCHAFEKHSMKEFWNDIRRSFAPIVLLEDNMGKDFEPVAKGIENRLLKRYGDDPVSIDMPAWLALGRK